MSSVVEFVENSEFTSVSLLQYNKEDKIESLIGTGNECGDMVHGQEQRWRFCILLVLNLGEDYLVVKGSPKSVDSWITCNVSLLSISSTRI